jgi:hypothetical protein
MSSLYEELQEKLSHDPRLMKRGGPRVDTSLLLFNARAAIDELWKAAEADLAETGLDAASRTRLGAAVDELRPIFGPRG